MQNRHSVTLQIYSISCCSIELNLKSWTGNVTQILKKNWGAIVALLWFSFSNHSKLFYVGECQVFKLLMLRHLSGGTQP